jgi:tetratricopeptide (TPR) repeat protein
VELKRTKEAVIYFSNFIKARPKNVKGWKELIRCLYNGGFYEEAIEQVYNAEKNTYDKPVLFFYKSVILFALGKSKEGLLHLELAMQKSSKLVKHFIELNPSLLQNHQIVDIIAKYKRAKPSDNNY